MYLSLEPHHHLWFHRHLLHFEIVCLSLCRVWDQYKQLKALISLQFHLRAGLGADLWWPRSHALWGCLHSLDEFKPLQPMMQKSEKSQISSDLIFVPGLSGLCPKPTPVRPPPTELLGVRGQSRGLCRLGQPHSNMSSINGRSWLSAPLPVFFFVFIIPSCWAQVAHECWACASLHWAEGAKEQEEHLINLVLLY